MPIAHKHPSLTALALLLAATAPAAATSAAPAATTPSDAALSAALDDLRGGYTDGRLTPALARLETADPAVVVPLLQARLEQNVAAGTGSRSRSEHVMMKSGPASAIWIHIPAENNALARLLVHHRATAAATAVQAALDLALKEPKGHREGGTTRDLAVSLYTLTGTRPACYELDVDTPTRLTPRVHEELAMIALLHPELTPTRGLTASLRIAGKGDQGEYVTPDETLTVTLTLTNHAKTAAAIDPDSKSLTLEYTLSNTWKTRPGDALPAPTVALVGTPAAPATVPRALPAGASLTLTWTLTPKDLLPEADWQTDYHALRIRYAPRPDTPLAEIWSGDTLTTSPVTRTLLRQ
jgi:hypothetical protein